MAYNKSGLLLSSNKRAYRPGGLTRFANPTVTEPTPRYQAALPDDHLALVNSRTVFPSRVFDVVERDRILISGMNNAKIGRIVTKGPWAGFPIYTFALEERATCPQSCHLLAECYGNALPMAVRFRFNGSFLGALEEELAVMGDKHPGGFAVRAHVLGDFVSLDYVRHWQLWLSLVPQLHVWGYTAHQAGSEIGDAVNSLNRLFPGRWAFRHSVAPETEAGDWQASTTWDKPEQHGRALRGGGGLICPAEMGATQACATCALCWSPEAAMTRIVFLGHGKRHRGSVEKKPTPVHPAFYAPIARHDPSLDDMVKSAVAAGKITKVPLKGVRR